MITVRCGLQNWFPCYYALAHLSHSNFSTIPTELIADTGPEAAAACSRARAAALAGRRHDGQDPRSVAWHGAIQRAVATFLAQVRL